MSSLRRRLLIVIEGKPIKITLRLGELTGIDSADIARALATAALRRSRAA